MVFPLSDDNSDRTTFPIVNITLIVINVLVFVLFQGMGKNDNFTLAYATVPAEIASGHDLVSEDQIVQINTPRGVQQLEMPGLRTTPIPVYLTLLTAIFMHAGIMHLAGNMWFLWIFGDNIEIDLGKVRYLIFYLVCGLLASLAHVMVSASGPASLIPCMGSVGGDLGSDGGVSRIASPSQSHGTLVSLRHRRAGIRCGGNVVCLPVGQRAGDARRESRWSRLRCPYRWIYCRCAIGDALQGECGARKMKE